MSGKAYVLVFDGYADWEPAHALAELRRSGGMEVVTIGFSSQPITSMGGLRVLPGCTIESLDPADVRILILPGGEMWENDYPTGAVEDALQQLQKAQVPIAAICGATLAAARAGLLNDRRHTSNGKEYLIAQVAGYTGAAHYVDELAVRDRGVITASGVGNVEFARECLAELEVLESEDCALWFNLFKYGRFPEPA